MINQTVRQQQHFSSSPSSRKCQTWLIWKWMDFPPAPGREMAGTRYSTQKCSKEEEARMPGSSLQVSFSMSRVVSAQSCGTRWFLQALRLPYPWLGQELLLSLKHNKVLFCICAPEVMNNGDTCLTSCLGEIPSKQVRFLSMRKWKRTSDNGKRKL